MFGDRLLDTSDIPKNPEEPDVQGPRLSSSPGPRSHKLQTSILKLRQTLHKPSKLRPKPHEPPNPSLDLEYIPLLKTLNLRPKRTLKAPPYSTPTSLHIPSLMALWATAPGTRVPHFAAAAASAARRASLQSQAREWQGARTVGFGALEVPRGFRRLSLRVILGLLCADTHIAYRKPTSNSP